MSVEAFMEEIRVSLADNKENVYLRGFGTFVATSVYWAIVTMTTVGYGDITPVTAIGRLLSAFVMLLGYTIIAVPTGIVTAHIIDETKEKPKDGHCPRCDAPVRDKDHYCSRCGEKL